MEIKDIANNSDEILEDFASLVDQYPPASTETDKSAPAAPCKKDSGSRGRNICRRGAETQTICPAFP